MGLKEMFVDYPKHVLLILGNEFCERFSFYGMKAILVIYLTRALNFGDDDATAIYHGFNMACYFMPIFGALLADGLIGKYKTIMYISVVYALGNITMATSSIPINGSYTEWLSFIGLALIAVGTGGIKPCVSAFGADQFKEHQVKQKDTFFSMFYMAINLGSFLSMILTPILRSQVTCFGDDCYALAFGVPAGLMIVAVIFFVAGTRWYRIVPPGDNIIGKSCACIWTAATSRSKGEKREHWLDYADYKYEQSFIDDVKMCLRVMYMFLTFPIFWALYDQQGSRWILQAGQMNGDLGFFVIEPDLLPVVNPIFVLIMVPICESLLYPCLDRLNFPNKPLQRIGFGMFLASVSFAVTGFVQLAINASLPPPVPQGQAAVTVINSAPCDINTTLYADGKFVLSETIKYREQSVDVSTGDAYTVPMGMIKYDVQTYNCFGDDKRQDDSFEFEVLEETAYNFLYVEHAGIPNLVQHVQNKTDRTGKGRSTVVVYNAIDQDIELSIVHGSDDHEHNITMNEHSDSQELRAVKYDFKFHYKGETNADDVTVGSIKSQAGAVYSAVLFYSDKLDEDGKRKIDMVTHLEVTANDINILLQLPQYFIMTLGEVFFIISSMAFAYSQAPATMKAILQAAELMTNSFGNVIVIIVAGVSAVDQAPVTMKAIMQAAQLLTNSFGNLIVVIISGLSLVDQWIEFFIFSGLMFVTMLIYAAMATTYKYVEQPDEDKTEVVDNEMALAKEAAGEDNAGFDDPEAMQAEWEAYQGMRKRTMSDAEQKISSTKL